MHLVKVKDKFQITLPPEARDELGLEIGDLLEAQVANGKLTFTPKDVVDRSIARALDDVKRGRVRGPFATAAELVKDVRRRRGRAG